MGDSSSWADLPALHDALDGATVAAFAAEIGDRQRVAEALMEASAAATSAFAPGTREANALGVIFTAIDRATPGLDGPHVPEPELGD
jgi:putative Ca2+/H+ antiporter (TMEM165/GDT1 family)